MESGGDAGGGDDEGVGGQVGSQQADRGEGVDGAFHQQEGVGMVGGSSGQPEAAVGLAGAGSHALEGAAVGSGAGADDLGAGGLALGVAAEEDGVAAGSGRPARLSRNSTASPKRQARACMTRSIAPPPPPPRQWSKKRVPVMLRAEPGSFQRAGLRGSWR